MSYYKQYILTEALAPVQLNTVAGDLSKYSCLQLNFSAVEEILTALGTYKNTTDRFKLTFYQAGVLVKTEYFSHTAALGAYQQFVIDITDITTRSSITIWVEMDRTDAYKVYFTIKDYFCGVNPLDIFVNKNTNAVKRYAGVDTFANLQILPKGLSFQGSEKSKAADLAVDVQSYSGFKLDSIEFTAEDSTYN